MSSVVLTKKPGERGFYAELGRAVAPKLGLKSDGVGSKIAKALRGELKLPRTYEKPVFRALGIRTRNQLTEIFPDVRFHSKSRTSVKKKKQSSQDAPVAPAELSDAGRGYENSSITSPVDEIGESLRPTQEVFKVCVRVNEDDMECTQEQLTTLLACLQDLKQFGFGFQIVVEG